jgi:hypothetical protein
MIKWDVDSANMSNYKSVIKAILVGMIRQQLWHIWGVKQGISFSNEICQCGESLYLSVGNSPGHCGSSAVDCL